MTMKNTLGRGETGSTAALPIWLRFMQGATARMPVRSFTVPEGLEFAKIDPETGLRHRRHTRRDIRGIQGGNSPERILGRRPQRPFQTISHDRQRLEGTETKAG